ncbi:MAG: cysteine--tRNA ligase, partial [candidate division NC10 bacterium]|nr:cysteine--tRNA ligase [candidate division NC10 bacterium]
GGADLIFPHHENEIAQSECATGKPFARYWIHNGFVNIRAEKMSKSLGNILTVRELLGRISPCALKLFLLGTHYRAPVDFSEDALNSAMAAEDRFRNVLDEVRRFRDIRSPKADLLRIDPLPLLDQIREAKQEFTDAMDDDLNTPRALAALFNLTRGMNIALSSADSTPKQSLVHALGLAGETLSKLGSVLGGLFEGKRVSFTRRIPVGWTTEVSQKEYLEARDAIESTAASGRPLPEDKIEIIVQYRAQCRDRKDWATADAIRAWLADLEVVVDDIGDKVRMKTQRP